MNFLKSKFKLWVIGGIVSMIPYLIIFIVIVIIILFFYKDRGNGIILYQSDIRVEYYDLYKEKLNKYLKYNDTFEDGNANEGQGYVTLERTFVMYNLLMETYCNDNVSSNWESENMVDACAAFYYAIIGYNYKAQGYTHEINGDTCVVGEDADLVLKDDVDVEEGVFEEKKSYKISGNYISEALFDRRIYCYTGYQRPEDTSVNNSKYSLRMGTNSEDGTILPCNYYKSRFDDPESLNLDEVNQLDDAFINALLPDNENYSPLAAELFDLAYSININENHFMMTFEDACDDLTEWYNNEADWEHYAVGNICSDGVFTNISQRIQEMTEENDTPYYFLNYPLEQKINGMSPKISSVFNKDRGEMTATDGSTIASHPHGGWDIGAAEGTKIYSSCDGEVVEEGFSSSGGNYVKVKCDDTYSQDNLEDETFKSDIVFYVTYMHMMSRSELRIGEQIIAGALIGYVGNTGNSTGAHLHFQLDWKAETDTTGTQSGHADTLYYVDWRCYFDGICYVANDFGNEEIATDEDIVNDNSDDDPYEGTIIEEESEENNQTVQSIIGEENNNSSNDNNSINSTNGTTNSDTTNTNSDKNNSNSSSNNSSDISTNSSNNNTINESNSSIQSDDSSIDTQYFLNQNEDLNETSNDKTTGEENKNIEEKADAKRNFIFFIIYFLIIISLSIVLFVYQRNKKNQENF